MFTPNAIATHGTTSQMLFRGLEWLQKNPLVRDPIRPNQVDRIITSAIGFGTTFTFETEMTAYGLDAYPQVVLGLKGVAHRLRRMGNQPIAAAGQFGIPVGSGQAASTTVGDLKGEPLPAILNEVISVTGTYPFPFLPTAITPPTDPSQGAIPRPIAPLVISGGVPTISHGCGTGGQRGRSSAAGDLIVYADKLLASANRTWTTDYAAPAVDIPTFRRTFAGGGPGYNVLPGGWHLALRGCDDRLVRAWSPRPSTTGSTSPSQQDGVTGRRLPERAGRHPPARLRLAWPGRPERPTPTPTV